MITPTTKQNIRAATKRIANMGSDCRATILDAITFLEGLKSASNYVVTISFHRSQGKRRIFSLAHCIKHSKCKLMLTGINWNIRQRITQ